MILLLAMKFSCKYLLYIVKDKNEVLVEIN